MRAFDDLAQKGHRVWDRDERPWLVGQAPSATGDPDKPCTGRFGRRLCSVAGGDPSERDLIQFLTAFRRVNVLYEHPGTLDGKGDAFPLDRARVAADAMARVWRDEVVVLCGKTTVARAFGCEDDYFTWHAVRGNRMAVFPHPSGVNRFWNDDDNRDRAGRFLRGVITGEGVPDHVTG